VRRIYGRTVEQTERQGHRTDLVFLCEEFFHPDLGGFGGFGKTVKNAAEHFNGGPASPFRVTLFHPQGSSLVDRPEFRRYHDTDVLLRPPVPRTDHANFDSYSALANFAGRKVFISIDWYPSYTYPLYAASAVPLVVWIRDPRDRAEWLRIGSVADELTVHGVATAEELATAAGRKEASIKRLLALQASLPRKIVFAATSMSLVQRAERTYGLPGLKAHWLPNPIPIPEVDPTEQSARPSLLFLGRLDPVKRPWIAFELARRHPDVDFLIAGNSHFEDVMAPWISRYRSLPNLKFHGHIDGEAKDSLLRQCWGLLNTSIHEGEPVSFLEAFSYGKCVIACLDLDRHVSRFGYFAGESLGEGLDVHTLGRFGEQIERLVSGSDERREKGMLARQEMQANHTFESFRRHLSAILETEGILS
jgi:glycosyltransferase involved in cell wall biosynthesis